ncbi:NAD-dependent epimerase/dehydratase family protein [Echinicola rosea]|uniref:UDP-galactose-4-epimerase n=1 Tax=Echinicola rosea TaxID=1807691 RepID=A0ABQ1VBE7_9BACT|nr:NAD(P)-dependent oxidoreductase [Echinicola rosea]GGF51643.1 UDP-galactose-4-epimerase [Echinicola rosea]
MNNVLLTGGRGFLNTILIEALEEESNMHVVTVGRSNADIQVDIRDVFTIPTSENFDMVIHAAGKAHSNPITTKEENEFHLVNFEGTKNLCRALEGLGVIPKKFIFISTVAVYGVTEGIDIKEEHPLNGVSAYAYSKILAETWLQDWAYKHNVTLGILRLPLIVGPNPPGNLQKMISGIKSGRYLSIGDANARKSMVFGEDIAKIIPLLAKKGGTYNLTDGYHPTFRELEMVIAASLERKKPIKVPFWFANGLARIGDITGNRFPIDSDKLKKITSVLTFDDSKARKELGWSPSNVLEKLAEILK